ncbi:hypothetical protein V6N11_016693 [Hibiscus sabdariffa]|uniref:Uncharacterized protein n=1 Tax=Hibiscus sabdariffa TaxID=183260 RepID=A0ABR2TWB1_9ROSI
MPSLYSRSSEVKNETGSTNVHDGDVNTTGFVCSCAGHGSTKGQGKTQAGASASGQWFIDSGATHHVTPEATKVGQGSEYAGPESKNDVTSATSETTRGCSNELLVVPELHKFSTKEGRNITGERSCQGSVEETAVVHEEGSCSRHSVDEGSGRSRVEEAVLSDTAAESHEDLFNDDFAGPEDGSHAENLAGIEDDSADMHTDVHEDGANNSHEVDTNAEEGSTAEMELFKQTNQHPMKRYKFLNGRKQC